MDAKLGIRMVVSRDTGAGANVEALLDNKLYICVVIVDPKVEAAHQIVDAPGNEAVYSPCFP
ncbi:hypothetical protein D3C81_2126250 [compost metagenome]